MTEEPLITVVVPVYKVEAYLEQCVQSIVGQTYRRLEVILVDDGSPDQCPRLCDQWTERDARVRVIHQRNAGLSAARNAGLDAATGELVAFVDSDDWIAPDMYERLLQGLRRQPDAGVADGQILWHRFSGRVMSYSADWVRTADTLVPAAEVLSRVAGELVSTTVWNKLFRRSLLGDLRFPVGRNNEDWHFMFRLALQMQERGAALLEVAHPCYHYVEHRGSISHASAKLLVDILANQQEARSLAEARGLAEVATIVGRRHLTTVLVALDRAATEGWPDADSQPFWQALRQLDWLASMRLASLRLRLALCIVRWCPPLWRWGWLRSVCMRHYRVNA